MEWWQIGNEKRHCCDCRNGEHANYDDDIRLVVIRDPDTNKLYRRGYICARHRLMYEIDGFVVS